MLFDTEKMNQDYESIRPYNDEETSAALKRVADSVELASISAFHSILFPNKNLVYCLLHYLSSRAFLTFGL